MKSHARVGKIAINMLYLTSFLRSDGKDIGFVAGGERWMVQERVSGFGSSDGFDGQGRRIQETRGRRFGGAPRGPFHFLEGDPGSSTLAQPGP
jgi:hypothetical protein